MSGADLTLSSLSILASSDRDVSDGWGRLASVRRATWMVVTTLAGCAGAPPAARQPPSVPLTRFPVGAPLVTPGERFSYRLQLGGVDLATYDVAVGSDFTEVAGKRAIVVQSHAKTIGLAAVVAHIDDSFASWLDVTTGRPLRWQVDEFAVKSTNKERTDVQLVERAGNVVPVEFHLNDSPPESEPQTVSLDDVWDLNALSIVLRSWEAPVGTSVDAEVFRSRYMWHLRMTMRGGRDTITTELGDLPAHRVDGHVSKVARNDVKVAGTQERDFSVWISDDDGRVPLKISAKTDYGDVVLMLSAYDPGTGTRLRN